ncbi:MAG: translational machinery protein, partial [Pseudomonadota bacterium]|nr:translational machinery protein [Pseudomonadota bacterium]
IAVALKDATGILVVGPAQEKNVFATYLTTHAPAVSACVEAVETVDHPTSGELLTYARKYFVKAGAMK